MDIITLGGTAGKRELSDWLLSRLAVAWLLALEEEDVESGGLEGAADTEYSGSQLREALSELFPDDAIVIVEANACFSGLGPVLSLCLVEKPLEELSDYERVGCTGAGLVLVDWGPGFEGSSELGIEKAVKAATGAVKVLIYDCQEGRDRAFEKVLDIVISRIGGRMMPEDVPLEVMEAVKKEARESKMSCERAHELAKDLGVPLEIVGRALDLQNIKITTCRLGCF